MQASVSHNKQNPNVQPGTVNDKKRPIETVAHDLTMKCYVTAARCQVQLVTDGYTL